MTPENEQSAEKPTPHSSIPPDQTTVPPIGSAKSEPDSKSESFACRQPQDFDEFLNKHCRPRRHWVLGIFLVLLTTAGASAAAWYFQPRIYTATSILQVQSPIRLLFNIGDEPAPDSEQFEIYKRSQRQWMKSSFVLSAALRDVSLHATFLRREHDPAAWLEENLEISFPEGAELMLVSLSAEDPDGLNLTLNSIVDAYFREVVYVEKERGIRRIERLELAHKAVENKYRTKQQELKMVAESQHTGPTEPNARSLALQREANLLLVIQQDQLKVDLDLIHARSDLEVAEKLQTASIQISDRQLRTALRDDPQAVQVGAEVQEIADQFAQLSDDAEEKDANQKREFLQSRRSNLEKKYQELQDSMRQELIEEQKKQAAADLQSAKRKLAMLSQRKEQLTAQAADVEFSLKRLSRVSIDLEILRREVATLEEMRDHLNRELEHSLIEMAANKYEAGDSRVVLKSKATLPEQADARKITSLTIGIGAGVFVLSLLGVVGWNLRRPSSSLVV